MSGGHAAAAAAATTATTAAAAVNAATANTLGILNPTLQLFQGEMCKA